MGRVQWSAAIAEDNTNSVFSDDGTSITCTPCSSGVVKSCILQSRRAFCVSRWNEHQNTKGHQEATAPPPEGIKVHKQEKLFDHSFTAVPIIKKRFSPPTNGEDQAPRTKKPAVSETLQKISPKQCYGIVPSSKCYEQELFAYQKYCVMLPSVIYAIRHDNRGKLVLVAKTCQGGGRSRKGGLVCCDECFTIKNAWTSVQKIIKKAHLKYQQALMALESPTMNDLLVSYLTSINFTEDKYLSNDGLILKAQCHTAFKFYNTALQLKKDHIPLTSQSPTGFLMEFQKLYLDRPNDRKDLVFLLAEAFVHKQTGKGNAIYDDRLMNFYIAIHSMDVKTANLVLANLPSPCLRQVRRSAGKMIIDIPVIATKKEDILQRLKEIIESIREGLDKEALRKPLAFSVSIDGTAVAPAIEYTSRYNLIVGHPAPDHAVMLPPDATRDQIKEHPNPNSNSCRMHPEP